MLSAFIVCFQVFILLGIDASVLNLHVSALPIRMQCLGYSTGERNEYRELDEYMKSWEETLMSKSKCTEIKHKSLLWQLSNVKADLELSATLSYIQMAKL